MSCPHRALTASRGPGGKIIFHCKRCGEEIERPETSYRDEDRFVPTDFRFALAKQALHAAEEAKRNRPVTSAEGTTREMFIGFIMKAMEAFFIGLDRPALEEIAQDMLKDFLDIEQVAFADPTHEWDQDLAQAIVEEQVQYYQDDAASN